MIMHHELLWVDIFALGGCDGIVHGGWPYTMLEALAKGDWLKTLQSPRSNFLLYAWYALYKVFRNAYFWR